MSVCSSAKSVSETFTYGAGSSLIELADQCSTGTSIGQLCYSKSASHRLCGASSGASTNGCRSPEAGAKFWETRNVSRLMHLLDFRERRSVAIGSWEHRIALPKSQGMAGKNYLTFAAMKIPQPLCGGGNAHRQIAASGPTGSIVTSDVG